LKILPRALALVGATALTLAACGTPPDEGASTGDGSDAGGASSDFKACMVSDEGGFDDSSFNESGFNGLKKAEKDLGIETQTAESKDSSEYERNIDNLINSDCNLIVSVGFNLGTATGTKAKANPDTQFAIIDSTAQDEDGKPIEVDNVKPISFDTAQAAYLAGYAAAGTSKTGKVGTYGGGKIPTTTIFMDGFADGVDKYNEAHDADVALLGWNKDKQDGSFTGDFTDAGKSTALADSLYEQGADIVMPVAGEAATGVLASAKKDKDRKVVWVDTDGYESLSDKDAKPLLLTSVQKGIEASTEDVIKQAADGKFENDPYVGTLENEGVQLAPYHDQEDAVPADVKDEVDQLRQDIIDGKITVESKASPQSSED
jgi:basic membrane protein A